MADNFGNFSFLVEGEEHDWHGTIDIPKKAHKVAKFDVTSYHKPNTIKPFIELGEHDDRAVHAWLNLGRPATFLDSFVTFRGFGAWRIGSRLTAKTGGEVSDILFDVHLQSEEKCITSFGITTDTITNLFHHQTPTEEKIQTDNDPPKCSRSLYEYEIKPGLKMRLTAMYQFDPFLDHEKLKRVPVKFISEEPLNILDVRKLLRLVLSASDFLAGYSEGEVANYIYDDENRTNNFRISTRKRRKKSDSFFVSTKDADCGALFAHVICRLLEDDTLNRNINCVLFALGGSMNIYEKFIRLFAYIEPVLRERYESPSTEAQHRYIEGIKDYNTFLENAPAEIRNFSKEFAKPKYPNRKPLKYLLEAAISECTDFGMTVKPKYWNEITDIRNDVFHGVDRDDDEWIDRIIYAGEVLTVLLELLTAKDLGLRPGINYFSRYDRYSTQLGIFKTEKSA